MSTGRSNSTGTNTDHSDNNYDSTLRDTPISHSDDNPNKENRSRFNSHTELDLDDESTNLLSQSGTLPTPTNNNEEEIDDGYEILPEFSIKEEDEIIPEEPEPFVLITTGTIGNNYKFDPNTNHIQQSVTLWRAKLITRKVALIAGATLPPLTLAVNAFCAFPHIKTAELTLDKIKELSGSMLALCVANGASSYGVNAILNYGTIPKAFDMFYDRMYLHIGKHPIKNAAILTLALGAGVSAAAVGYSSFLPLGVGFAWTNFATNGFIFSVTRFYGLVNALHRFENWYSHNYDANPLTGMAFDELLTHVTDDCAQELEIFLKNHHPETNEETIVALLTELNRIIKERRENKLPPVIENRSKAEIAGLIFDVVAGLMAGIAVAPAFAFNFLKGLDKLKALVTNEPDSIMFNEFSLWSKSLLSSLSIATSILYIGQTSLLRGTVNNAYQAIIDPTLSTNQKRMKAAGAAGLLVANGFACSSLYNLAETANNTHGSPAAELTPGESPSATAIQIMAAAAAFAVNTKLSAEKALPAPANSTTPTITRIDSSASVPNLVRQVSTTPPLGKISETEEENDTNEEKESKNSEESKLIPQSIFNKKSIDSPHPLLDQAIALLRKKPLLKDNLKILHALNTPNQNHATFFTPQNSPKINVPAPVEKTGLVNS
jgi:hypothetical protein